jgi:hypothetical protein
MAESPPRVSRPARPSPQEEGEPLALIEDLVPLGSSWEHRVARRPHGHRVPAGAQVEGAAHHQRAHRQPLLEQVDQRPGLEAREA